MPVPAFFRLFADFRGTWGGLAVIGHDASFSGPIARTFKRRIHPVDATGRCNTLDAAQAVEVLQMKQRRRIYYTETQKALMWERWRNE